MTYLQGGIEVFGICYPDQLRTTVDQLRTTAYSGLWFPSLSGLLDNGEPPLGTGMASLLSLSDLVSLGQTIFEAVKRVHDNEEECQAIADRVHRILQALNSRKTRESPEALQGLHQTLKEILAFVDRFGDVDYLQRFHYRNTGAM